MPNWTTAITQIENLESLRSTFGFRLEEAAPLWWTKLLYRLAPPSGVELMITPPLAVMVTARFSSPSI
jgi:hypothetical protein